MTWYVLGAGISGISAAKLLLSRGEKVHFFSPTKPKNPHFFALKASYSQEPQTLPEDAKGLILSPSAPADHPLRLQILSRNLPALTDIDLALQKFHGKIISVTGTNGKSSTVHMIEHILRKKYNARAAGNIGISPCEWVLQDSIPDILILEVSSYQIELSQPISSDVAIWTTFSEDHLGRHKTLKKYFQLKAQLLEDCTGPVIVGPSVEYQPSHPKPVHHPKPCPGFAELHNQHNAAWALLACQLLMKEEFTWDEYLADYQGLPHRFSKLSSPASHIINDSKSTNLESTLEALKSMPEPCQLLVGGLDKQEDFTALKGHPKVSRYFLFGQAGPRLQTQLQTPDKIFPTLAEAVAALDLSQPVLFSPGCASQDEFLNFEHRGECFSQSIYERFGVQNAFNTRQDQDESI